MELGIELASGWKPFLAGRPAAFPEARLLRLYGDRGIDALLQRVAIDGANTS